MLAAQPWAPCDRVFENSKTHKLEQPLSSPLRMRSSERGARLWQSKWRALWRSGKAVINEEGSTQDLISTGRNIWAVSVARRGNVWIEVSVKGQGQPAVERRIKADRGIPPPASTFPVVLLTDPQYATGCAAGFQTAS